MLDNNNTVTIVFYTPESEKLESEAYVESMSRVSRLGRELSHIFNTINSQCTTATVAWNSQTHHLGLLPNNFTSDHVSPTVATSEHDPIFTQSESNCLFSCALNTQPTSSNTIVVESDTRPTPEVCDMKISPNILNNFRPLKYDRAQAPPSKIALDTKSRTEWNRDTVQSNLHVYKPNYSHVEIIIDNCTYSIRWGECISKYPCKPYESVQNAYTVLSLSLSYKAYGRLKRYCDTAFDDIDGFNYYGLYFNFLTPEWIRRRVCENGHSYWNKKAVFCSEFLTRALCYAGIFNDLYHQHHQNLHVQSENGAVINSSYYGGHYADSNLASGGDDLVIQTSTEMNLVMDPDLLKLLSMDKYGGIWLDPACTSPNMLYIALLVRKLISLTKSGDSVTPSSPFSGPIYYHIRDDLVPCYK